MWTFGMESSSGLENGSEFSTGDVAGHQTVTSGGHERSALSCGDWPAASAVSRQPPPQQCSHRAPSRTQAGEAARRDQRGRREDPRARPQINNPG
jgi:hypothetical protein